MATIHRGGSCRSLGPDQCESSAIRTGSTKIALTPSQKFHPHQLSEQQEYPLWAVRCWRGTALVSFPAKWIMEETC